MEQAAHPDTVIQRAMPRRAFSPQIHLKHTIRESVTSAVVKLSLDPSPPWERMQTLGSDAGARTAGKDPGIFKSIPLAVSTSWAPILGQMACKGHKDTNSDTPVVAGIQSQTRQGVR